MKCGETKTYGCDVPSIRHWPNGGRAPREVRCGRGDGLGQPGIGCKGPRNTLGYTTNVALESIRTVHLWLNYLFDFDIS